MRAKAQQGWTLLEIVLLVLIVGLILAGVVKGQEMITSAKVKRIAGQLDEIRASYLGFRGPLQGTARRLRRGGSGVRVRRQLPARQRRRPDSQRQHAAERQPGARGLAGVDASVAVGLPERRLPDGRWRGARHRRELAQEPVLGVHADRLRRPVWRERQRRAAPQLEVRRAGADRSGRGARPQDRRRQAVQGRGAVLDVRRQRRAPAPRRAARTVALRCWKWKRIGTCAAATPTAELQRCCSDGVWVFLEAQRGATPGQAPEQNRQRSGK